MARSNKVKAAYWTKERQVMLQTYCYALSDGIGDIEEVISRAKRCSFPTVSREELREGIEHFVKLLQEQKKNKQPATA